MAKRRLILILILMYQKYTLMQLISLKKYLGQKLNLKEDLNGKILLSAKFKSINDLYTILKKLSN